MIAFARGNDTRCESHAQPGPRPVDRLPEHHSPAHHSPRQHRRSIAPVPKWAARALSAWLVLTAAAALAIVLLK
jgi:hypothetical protein